MDPSIPATEGTRVALRLRVSVVIVVAALIAAAIAGIALSGRQPDRAQDAAVVVLGRPSAGAFEMVVVRRGDDPSKGVVVSDGATGRGVIDLRRSLGRALWGGVALGPRVAKIDDHRVAYSIAEGDARVLVLVDFSRHSATRLFRGTNAAEFYSDAASGWLMVHDAGPDGAICSRIRPASSKSRLETFPSTLECGFEPGGAVVVLNQRGDDVRAEYSAPGHAPVSFPAGTGSPILDGIHHEIIGQERAAFGDTRVVVYDSATGKRRYVSAAAPDARSFGLSPEGAFFVELSDGQHARVTLVRNGHASLVAQQEVANGVVTNDGTALLVLAGTTSNRVERVRPGGRAERLLDAPDVELRLVPGAAPTVFAWSAQQTVYSGFADHGPLVKAGTLPEALYSAYTHPSSATALFLTFDDGRDSGNGTLFSVRAGGALTRLWSGLAVRALDMTSDGRRVVMEHGPDNYGYVEQTGALIASSSIPTGHEAPDLITLDELPHTLGALMLEPGDEQVLYTVYQGAPDASGVRNLPQVRSTPVVGAKKPAVRYDGWSLLDLGDSSESLVLVAGTAPFI